MQRDDFKKRQNIKKHQQAAEKKNTIKILGDVKKEEKQVIRVNSITFRIVAAYVCVEVFFSFLQICALVLVFVDIQLK